MAKQKKNNETTPETTGVTADQKLAAFVHNTRAEHHNYEETIYYKVSTGSLQLDAELNGGVSPGVLRLVGINQGGKTPEAFEVMRNFFKVKPNSRGVYFKAEGRLSPETQQRSGLNFVFGDPENAWKPGTCYVHESNIMENILELIELLIADESNKDQYCFIVDSIDGILRREDKVNKKFSDAQKVAGPQVVWKNFFKYMNALQKRGHILILISQVSAKVEINPYGSSEPARLISATGGNALLHWADVILDYQTQYHGDLILKDPKNKTVSDKNPIIGHECKIVIKKSANESSGTLVKVPIRHGMVGGKSIWKEREIVSFLLSQPISYIIQRAAWFNFEESYLAELRESGFNLEDKYQGIDAIYAALDADEKLTERLYKDCLVLLNARNTKTC